MQSCDIRVRKSRLALTHHRDCHYLQIQPMLQRPISYISVDGFWLLLQRRRCTAPPKVLTLRTRPWMETRSWVFDAKVLASEICWGGEETYRNQMRSTLCGALSWRAAGGFLLNSSVRGARWDPSEISVGVCPHLQLEKSSGLTQHKLTMGS